MVSIKSIRRIYELVILFAVLSKRLLLLRYIFTGRYPSRSTEYDSIVTVINGAGYSRFNFTRSHNEMKYAFECVTYVTHVFVSVGALIGARIRYESSGDKSSAPDTPDGRFLLLQVR